jgi:hypothetical protein
MCKLLFSILFLTYIGNVLAQDKKNQIGLEVLKPVYAVVHSQIANGEDKFRGYNFELAYTRVIIPYISYRASGGIVKYGLENTRFNYEYRSKGWFVKQGLDINPRGEEKKFNFIVGISAIVSNYQETQRGFFVGNYYPTAYTPYDKYQDWVFGGEFALRFRWLLGDCLVMEYSVKGAVRSSSDVNQMEKMYIPGFGPMINKEIPLNSVSFPGLEFKLYFRF